MTFKYTYSAPENKEVQEIRKKYLPQEENKLELMRKLDYQIRMAGTMESLIIGVIGFCLFGLGICMSCQIIGGGIVFGVILFLLGVAGMLPAYPTYKKVHQKAKDALAPKILQLADEINGKNQD